MSYNLLPEKLSSPSKVINLILFELDEIKLNQTSNNENKKASARGESNPKKTMTQTQANSPSTQPPTEQLQGIVERLTWVWSKPVGDTQKISPHPFVLASPPQLQPTTFDHTRA